MREEYVFEIFFFFFKLDLKEATIGVMQFHTQITHVYRQFWALSTKQQKKIEEKLFWKYGFRLVVNFLLVYKITLKNKCKKVKNPQKT